MKKSEDTTNPRDRINALVRHVLLGGVSTLALGAAAAPAMAQDAGSGDEIIVTGIRGSLERAMDIKRNSSGVVDAISAEDIGKFPDTNLAESLQRITGVSIDRVNGEGSKITVRGFGPGYNLITLNGRTLPTADIGVIGERGNYGAGGDRSFDFSNLASEAVSSLEVYKTGEATIPSGGIGATVNIVTRRPLDNPGLDATLGAKIINDTSVENGDDFTPELSGLFSLTNPSETFGVSLFGSYSKRDSGAPSQQINDWIVRRSTDGTIDSSYRRGDGSTVIENPPAPGQLYAVAQDSRYDLADITRERLNGQLVVQFRPMDNLTITGDYTYALNEGSELRYEQTNWFATPMDHIIFDNDGPVATAVFMQENNNGTKDIGFEQTNRATKDQLDSAGFNAEWNVNDGMSVILDAHSSKASSGGANPLGHSATFVTFGAPVILQHQVDYRSGYPIQDYTIDDSIKGDDNGVLSVGDLATQVQRSASSRMEHDIDEIDLRTVFDVFENSTLTVGANYRDSSMTRWTSTTQQDLGSWGLAFPGDVEQYAPGMVETYCLSCVFDDVPVGKADVAFKSDAADLFPIFQEAYSGNAVTVSQGRNTVQEQITSLYAQFRMDLQFLGRPARLNAGLRYEETELASAAAQSVPGTVRWTADNDFIIDPAPGSAAVQASHDYTNTLPNVDFQVDLTDNLVARTSYSKTISRVPYTNLFAGYENLQAPNRPTALGGVASVQIQDPTLEPLESENWDVSLEWYYGDASFVSVGYFDKTVSNFLGTAVVDGNFFGLQDPASGAAGTRSGAALDVINDLGVDVSEAHLFTLTALIEANGGNVAAAQAEFESHLVGGVLPQDYVDDILGQYDVVPNGADPLLTFALNTPINDFDGNINGWELAWQHFFGDTGFGFSANYTIVDGDVGADPASDPNENQFALVGLSDTANITAIYENFGWSARLAYNWRDTFLSETNSGGDRSGIYVEDYGQYDLSVSYDITENLMLTFEGINLTGEDQRSYHRVPEQVYYVYELSPRYSVGARYRF